MDRGGHAAPYIAFSVRRLSCANATPQNADPGAEELEHTFDIPSAGIFCSVHQQRPVVSYMDTGSGAVFNLSCLHLFLWEKVNITSPFSDHTLLYPVFAIWGFALELMI